MTQTTRRLRETSVVIVDSHIPDGMTIAQYRRARDERDERRRATGVVTRRLQIRAARG